MARNTDIVIDGRFTPEGLSVSAYGESNELLDETWFTWDEIEELKGIDQSDFTFEIEVDDNE